MIFIDGYAPTQKEDTREFISYTQLCRQLLDCDGSVRGRYDSEMRIDRAVFWFQRIGPSVLIRIERLPQLAPVI
jgi:hypothetical protein